MPESGEFEIEVEIEKGGAQKSENDFCALPFLRIITINTEYSIQQESSGSCAAI